MNHDILRVTSDILTKLCQLSSPSCCSLVPNVTNLVSLQLRSNEYGVQWTVNGQSYIVIEKVKFGETDPELYFQSQNYIMPTSFIHSFRSLPYDRSTATSKASSPYSVI